MIKILILNLILFTTLSLVNCGGASTPSDPPNNTLPQQNQNDRSHGDNGTAPTPYPFDEELLSGGIYEGELDANGRFTGYGVWIYYSNRYEGYFVDGLPNGEGTLHLSNDAWDISTTYTGTFINGSAQGLVTRIDINKSDSSVHTYQAEVNMGRSGDDIYCTCGVGIPHGVGALWPNVPPFAEPSIMG